MTLLEKYSIIYLYLAMVMGTAFAVSKHFRNNEVSRNIIHICAGLGWIFYKLLFPETIHPIIISSSFVLLTVITTKMKISFVERESGTYGTVFFTLSMLVMSVLGYKNHLLFDIFGIAMLCLSCGDAMANIVGSRFGTITIYKNKSIQGTIACFCISVLVMVVLKYAFGIELGYTSMCFLAMLCSITELLAGDYDNIAIPSVLYMVAYIILTNTNTLHLLISIAFGVFMFGFAMKLKLLNISASYILSILIFVLLYFGGLKSYISLMLVFMVVIVVEKCLNKKTENIFSSMNKEHGVRNERQLLANCLIAIISVAVYGITKNEIFIVAFFATIAETIGDSVASEIGVLSKMEPRDICSLKKVPRGASGGISLIGTGAALGVCVYTGVVYICVYGFDVYGFVVVCISSFAGIVLDSFLGSKVQIQYRCMVCKKITEKESHCGMSTAVVKGWKFFDNTRVNLICNVFSCGVACFLMNMR